MPQLWTRENDKIKLHFHPGQQRAWDSNKRFVLVIAGTQSGKTAFGPWWLMREISQRGPGDYLAVSATYDLFKRKMLPELLLVFQELAVLGTAIWRASERTIELPDMKAQIVLRSAESTGGLESSTAKAAWLDECGQPTFTRLAWEAVLRRLSLAQGRVLATTTLYNLGWLTDAIDEYEAGRLPDWDIIHFPSTANPAFPQEEFERARREMAPWRFAMMYEGEKARPTNLIYPEYNTDTCRVAPFLVPNHWRRFAGVDPGGANTAVVWIAESDNDQNEFGPAYYVYDELLTGGGSTPDLVERVRAIDPLVLQYWGGAQNEDQVRRDWAASGQYLNRPPVLDVEQGIARVTALLRQGRLFVFENCESLHREFLSYSRTTASDGDPRDTIADKNAYHLLDALRYVVTGLTGRVHIPPAQHRPIYSRAH